MDHKIAAEVEEAAKTQALINAITEDANTLASSSPAAQTAISVIILAKRLIACAEAALHYEVMEAWDVENANRVLSVMRSAAHSQAQQPYAAAELFHSLLGYGIPFVDVLMRSSELQQVAETAPIIENQVAPEESA